MEEKEFPLKNCCNAKKGSVVAQRKRERGEEGATLAVNLNYVIKKKVSRERAADDVGLLR